ncbi:O-antigen polymerase [Aeromonas sp. 2HA2]|uniref:O-antigen polymerase n=1 Tax=Aeromonas sp. 2HA2 TaxID=2699194 RepID=UPI0031F5C70D
MYFTEITSMRYCSCSGFIVWIMCSIMSLGLMFYFPGRPLEFMFIYMSFISVLFFLITNKDIFEPFYLFSLYYLSLIASSFILRLYGFENNNFMSTVYFYNDVDDLYFIGVVSVFISYLSAWAGYSIFNSKNEMPKPIEVKAIGSNYVFFIAVAFYAIGVCNFVLNIVILYDGDLLAYYKNISMRAYDFQKSVTTLGYQFMYVGTYILFISSLQKNKTSVLVFLAIIISFLISISNGRISQSIFYMATFFIINYYYNGKSKLNRKYVLFGAIGVLVGISMYIVRFASSLYVNAVNDDFLLSEFINNAINVDFLIGALFERGNLPNFPVFLKVIDSWSKDIGHMYGVTILHPLFSFISPNVFGLVEMPANLAKEQWYLHLPTGSLPVTGLGEMFVNFSYAGFIFGMFLFGALGAFIRNLTIKSRSGIFLIFYAKFSIGFYMLYPKGELNNLSLFWMLFASLVIYIIINLKSLLSSRHPHS